MFEVVSTDASYSQDTQFSKFFPHLLSVLFCIRILNVSIKEKKHAYDMRHNLNVIFR